MFFQNVQFWGPNLIDWAWYGNFLICQKPTLRAGALRACYYVITLFIVGTMEKKVQEKENFCEKHQGPKSYPGIWSVHKRGKNQQVCLNYSNMCWLITLTNVNLITQVSVDVFIEGNRLHWKSSLWGHTSIRCKFINTSFFIPILRSRNFWGCSGFLSALQLYL